jgi:hypothetical protein
MHQTANNPLLGPKGPPITPYFGPLDTLIL